MKKTPKVIFGSPENPLIIGDQKIQCYVLDNTTRVLTQASFLEALGRHKKANVRKEEGGEKLPAILQGKSIKPFISQELLEKSTPIKFKTENGQTANGKHTQKLFQRLTEDVGHPRLREHLSAVIALMKASSTWDQFYRMVQRALPKYCEQMKIDLTSDQNKQ